MVGVPALGFEVRRLAALVGVQQQVFGQRRPLVRRVGLVVTTVSSPSQPRARSRAAALPAARPPPTMTMRSGWGSIIATLLRCGAGHQSQLGVGPGREASRDARRAVSRRARGGARGSGATGRRTTRWRRRVRGVPVARPPRIRRLAVNRCASGVGFCCPRPHRLRWSSAGDASRSRATCLSPRRPRPRGPRS